MKTPSWQSIAREIEKEHNSGNSESTSILPLDILDRATQKIQEFSKEQKDLNLVASIIEETPGKTPSEIVEQLENIIHVGRLPDSILTLMKGAAFYLRRYAEDE